MSTLYLVATPIGNLGDITLRALEVLKSVPLIAAEDTRVTQKLLNHYQIQSRLISLYDQNESRRIPFLLEALEQGDVALVSDSGTPALNDPGYALVNAVIKAGHRVSPIPGACAPIAALISSGLPTNHFLYLGFLPRKVAEQKRTLQAISPLPYTLILLESPHRLIKTLYSLHENLGNRRVVVAREITKLHEEFWRGSLAEALEYFSSSSPRGEITIVIEGAPLSAAKWGEAELLKAIKQHLEAGMSAKELSLHLAKASGWQSKEIYHRAIQSKPSTKKASSTTQR